MVLEKASREDIEALVRHHGIKPSRGAQGRAKALEELLVIRGIDQGAEQHAAAAAVPFDLLMVMMVIPMVGSE